MRNLIFILIIFMTFLTVLKKDLPSIFIKNAFDKKISKIQVNNLKNLSPSVILNSIYLKEGDYFWKFNPKNCLDLKQHVFKGASPFAMEVP